MERRTFISTGVIGLATPLLLSQTTSGVAAKGVTPRTSAAERVPFIKIAKEKGVNIFFDKTPPASTLEQLDELHLDMNMVRASLTQAIERTKRKGSTKLSAKLKNLLDSGTSVQQVDFVLGSGTYYFPEDLESAIAKSESAQVEANGIDCMVCEWVCTTVCNCLQNGDQYCKDRCRNVCSKYC